MAITSDRVMVLGVAMESVLKRFSMYIIHTKFQGKINLVSKKEREKSKYEFCLGFSKSDFHSQNSLAPILINPDLRQSELGVVVYESMVHAIRAWRCRFWFVIYIHIYVDRVRIRVVFIDFNRAVKNLSVTTPSI